MLTKCALQRDLNSVWHPCMQMKEFEALPLIAVKEARGSYLYDFDGNGYIDGISSWWVNIFGHANPKLNKAISNQLEKFAHIMTANFTHMPMINLAERLISKTNGKLSRVFFADNGSSAIEAALKLSYQYYYNLGEQRDIFIAFENSYHGETLGALSVGDVGLYKKTYEKLLLKTVISPIPADTGDIETQKAIDALKENLKNLNGRACGVIIEPLVQCAGYMHMHSPEFLKKLREVCDEYNVHLILDEIAVGFGRTGSFFAHEQAGITPDIMCLSKGITGGYMPLSTVLCTSKIYEAFYDEKIEKAFLHSHSYSGNALACAAANAVLDIFEEEDTIKNLAPKIKHISDRLSSLSDNGRAQNKRQTGMIAAFELDTKEPKPSLSIFTEALKHGLFIRPLGNTVYVMPHLSITHDEIDKMFEAIEKTIKKVK
ncbi:MAG: adenosylmethionine--8-amino-7-oxononanoate transaminase [Campylobacterales bacterium]|nr:adenosylmethionine--8-amino-7-oxononanoate transaminase [Campylobacterales bacterium]